MEGQPTLPAEGTYSDAELAFIELSPPGMWPENQDSNFGQIRKVLTDIIQECIDEIDHLGEEMFVATASEYLPQWEEIVRTPIAPSGKTESQRRAIIGPRLKYGLFTRSRIREAIESFIIVTFGEAVSFTPAGVALLPGGLPLYSGTFSLAGTYRVYEDIRNFSYAVWVQSSTSIDAAALLKELQRITPSGITITLDNSRANVRNYHRTVLNKQPVAYFRLNGDAVDESGYANNGTLFNAPPTLAAPGLLDAAVDDDLAGNADAAIDFNGTTQYLSAPDQPYLDVGDSFSIEAWIRPDLINAVSHTIMSKGAGGFQLRHFNGQLQLVKETATTVAQATSFLMSAGVGYHVVVTKRGDDVKMYVDGAPLAVTLVAPGTVMTDTSSALTIGRRSFAADEWFNGVIDEAALYNYVLSAAQVLDNYNVGKNIAT